MNKATFLDRDGVIVEDIGYPHKIEQLKLIPKSAEAIKILNDNNFIVIIVTNQSGIAKGYFIENDTIIFNNIMEEELKKHDARIDAIYYCPHHPNGIIEKYKIDCNCRKPKSGMLIDAKKDFNINLNQSFIIGDRLTDMEAGKNVGCKCIMVLTGNGKYEKKNNKIDYIAQDLHDAVEHIIDNKRVEI